MFVNVCVCVRAVRVQLRVVRPATGRSDLVGGGLARVESCVMITEACLRASVRVCGAISERLARQWRPSWWKVACVLVHFVLESRCVRACACARVCLFARACAFDAIPDPKLKSAGVV